MTPEEKALQDLWFHAVFTDWLDPVGWKRFTERRKGSRSDG